MKSSKKLKIEAAGWKVVSTAEFLGLSPNEEAFVEIKIALCEQLRKQRLKNKITKAELAQLVASSQSRVAKTEAIDASVTIDLLVESLLAVGATRKEIATAFAA